MKFEQAPDVIQDSLVAARVRRGGEYARDPDAYAETLLGECPSNALALHEELERRGVDATIVRGGINIDDEPYPDTQQTIDEYGLAHWWVEAELDDGRSYVLDAVAETPTDRTGQTLVQRHTPEDYVKFEEPDLSVVKEMFSI